MSKKPSLATSVAIVSGAALLGFGGGALLATTTGTAGATAQAAAVGSTTASSAPATLTLATSTDTTAPGKEFRLSGTLSPATGSASLTIQRRLPGGDWTDFPVSASTKPDGSFSTKVLTERAGPNEFRVVSSVAGAAVTSPAVTVTVG